MVAVVLLLASLASLGVPWLALPVGFLVFLAWLSQPAGAPPWRRVVLGIAGAGAGLGLVRFIASDAMSGIVAGGNRAVEQRAVSRLRELVTAEDAIRRYGVNDADGDRVGSAARLTELIGATPPRHGALPAGPLLGRDYAREVPTPSGPARATGGFLILLCVPTPGGGYSAAPDATVDEERAEREFVAYAWPEQPRPGLVEAYAIDPHELILVARASDGRPPYVGPLGAPPCAATRAPPPGVTWARWRNKAPRTRLPGDPTKK